MVKVYLLRGLLVIVALAVLGGIAELLFIRFYGSPVPVPEIPRQKTFGTGKPLTFVVMGDSTAVGQGSAYDDGIAVRSARHLAQSREVRLINTGVSGATAKTVLAGQLAEAMRYHPDVVLLAVGANDATHFTRSAAMRADSQAIIEGLKNANPAVRIVVTGSPAMDAVDRFPAMSKLLMRLRTNQVNAVFTQLIAQNQLVLAPVAEGTRQAFLADPTLTADDNFHPNARGYALWIPIINKALDTAMGNEQV